MNEEKKIAQAIIDAQKMRENSYSEEKQEYNFLIEKCLIETCKQQNLSSNLWALLNLAMHWWNDIQLWAEDILADKNILEECEKENAKMKDEQKDIACCDLPSKEKCDQCQETDIANPSNH